MAQPYPKNVNTPRQGVRKEEKYLHRVSVRKGTYLGDTVCDKGREKIATRGQKEMDRGPPCTGIKTAMTKEKTKTQPRTGG